jgi:primosomal protein N' (replication factor Y)
MYADVAFPLKLQPLTYKIPLNSPVDLKGRIVKAPLAGKSCYGLVVSVTDKPCMADAKKLKEIREIHGHFASENGLSFLKWISEYYLAPFGTALKSSFFEEAAKAVVGSHQRAAGENAKEKNYRTFLFHAPSVSAERAQLNEILNPDVRGAIILAPEIGDIESILPDMKKLFGERLSVLHSKLTKAKRSDAIKKIISGEADIVLGTRSAVLAPLKNVSIIAVLGEHSPSYKGEEGLRYNARDAAVMRGFIEKAHVFLSSPSPSLESIYNSKIGKYALLKTKTSDEKMPEIKLVDMKDNKNKDLSISQTVLNKAKSLIAGKGGFLFLINRKGYSLIGCEDCGHIARCGKCGVPLVFYKSRGIMKCNYCGLEKAVAGGCEECKGVNIKPFGAGIEKIREELQAAFKAEPVQIGEIAGDLTPLTIGTSYAAKKLRNKKFDAAALLNADSLMSQPDFRAHERTFQEILKIPETIKPEGHLYIQTWSPKDKIFRLIRDRDFKGFYEHELSQRKMLEYPPFSKLMLFNISYKKELKKLPDTVGDIAGDANIAGVEILGPVEIQPILKSYPRCLQILLKSKDSRLLHSCARQLLDRLEKIKDAKINVDVDPLKV